MSYEKTQKNTLLTLKDIDDDLNVAWKFKLKQEAIRWIKYIREVHKDLDMEKCKEPEYFIKHFFNITEEEVRKHK